MNPKNTEIALHTKECISAAAAELLINGKDLTVTAICRKAGVSRNAFYRNFNCIDDTLIYQLAVGWAKYAERYKVAEDPQSDIMKHLIHYFYSEQKYILALRKHNLVHLVEQLFLNVIVPQGSTGTARYALYGTAYFTYGIIRAMIDNNFSDSPGKIEEMFKQKTQS